MFISTITALPSNARKFVIKSLVGSLNMSILGYLQFHLRRSKMENISNKGDVPNIDDYNEIRSWADVEDTRRKIFEDAGITSTVVPPAEMAEKLTHIRNFLESQILIDQPSPFDLPFTIRESLLKRLSTTSSQNEVELKQLAEALSIPLAELQRAGVRMAEDAQKDLRRDSGQMIDLYDEFSHRGVKDVEEADDTFSSLPAAVQYKLLVKLQLLLNKHYSKTINLVMSPRQRGHKDAITDIKMIEVVWKSNHKRLVKFDKDNMAELNAYVDRGGQLPEVPAVDDDGSAEYTLGKQIAAKQAAGIELEIEKDEKSNTIFAKVDRLAGKFKKSPAGAVQQ